MSSYESMNDEAERTIKNAWSARVPLIVLWVRADTPDFVIERISYALAQMASEFTASALMRVDSAGTKVPPDKKMHIELMHPPKVRHELDDNAVAARLSFYMLNPKAEGSA